MCSIEGCEKLAKARGLCTSHYARERKAGRLPVLADSRIHRLTNVDREARIADCASCGIGVRIRVRSGGQEAGRAECRTRRKEDHRRWLQKLSESGRKRDRSSWNETPEQRRDRRLRVKYGITQADYLVMYAAQEGKCAVCERDFELLCVDHCHDTGKVRGLLCHSCNSSLGHLRDDSYSAVNAARYLLRAGPREAF